MDSSTRTMKREFTTFSAMSVAFAFVSPIVALYSVLGLGLTESGPAFLWGGVILYIGQLIVVLTFGMLASKWSDSGGIYQWSRRLLGPRYGWLASWVYICTLLITIPAFAYAGAVMLPPIFDISDADHGLVTVLSIILILVTTLINLAGRAFIKALMYAVIVAEAVGSIGVAIWLLLFERNQDIGYLAPSQLFTDGQGFMTAPLVIAIAVSSYFAIGFESATSISEEVKSPKQAVPKAMLVAFFSIMTIVLLSSVAFILAIPNDEFLSNPDAATDPAVAILASTFPAPVFKGVLALFVIAFGASLMTIQMTASRLIWATARNNELPLSKYLRRLSGETGLPRVAVSTTAVIAVLLFIPFQSEGIQLALISFSSVGFFISFLFPVLGLNIARAKKTWTDDSTLFLGRFGPLISAAALVWLIFQSINVAWPRDTGTGWQNDWSTVIGVSVVLLLGLALESRIKPRKVSLESIE